MERRETRAAVLLSLLCSALALCIATTSSPLYATNFWTDSNLYFTIGRGMRAGLMPYRDLFDHKGPLIFLLYALGAWVSDTSFLGVFLLEILSLAAMLLFAYKTVALYGKGRLTLLTIPVTAAVTVCCTAFNQGGSAEEFCLPALSLALYCALRRMKADCAHPARWHAAFGAAAGWVFAIKYTDCGLFFGLGLALLLYEGWTRGLTPMAGAALCMLLGMAAVVLPIGAYLAIGGALRAMIRVYFVENIFGYGGASMSLPAHLYNALAYLRTQSAANPAVAGLAGAGCVFASAHALIVRRRGFVLEALATPLGAGLLLLFCYWGEMAHPYYALVFACLAPLGMIPLGLLARRVRTAGALCAAATLAIIPLCQGLCAAVPLQGVARSDMAQTVFAGIMNEEESPTLLDLTSLDQGFYLAAGITPNCRYFANNNLNTPEKREALDGYLREGRTMFVVSRWEDPGERYELVAEHASPFDLNDMRAYKLYRRREE